MSFNARNIRDAIVQTLEGTHQTVRDMAPGNLKHGVFEGQKEQAQLAKLIQSGNAKGYFDVEFKTLRRHSSSPMSALANSRLAYLDVSIPVWFRLPTQAQEDARVCGVADRVSILDDAIQALHLPHNLDATAEAGATNLISGMLFGDDDMTQEPVVTHVADDWDTKVASYQIDAVGVVNITQVTT